MSWLLVAFGGAIGAVARYAVGTWVQTLSKVAGFPIGTFTVNLVGCLLIGLFFGLFEPKRLPDAMRLLLVVGFLGGFTTFSSFGYETFELIKGGDFGLAFLNVFVQCSVGLLLVWLGTQLARLL